MQATFKVVTHRDIVVNNNDINPRVIEAPNTYFSLENWEFPESFIRTFHIMNDAPDIVSIVIVPTNKVVRKFVRNKINQMKFLLVHNS